MKWIKAAHRLPPMFKEVEWRNADGGNIPLGKRSPIDQVNKSGANISFFEWLDETESPSDSEAVAKIREAVANYMLSEGCTCCQGKDHGKHAESLGQLLKVDKYDDGSGYNFFKYRTQ